VDHSRKVTELYLEADNLVEHEDTFWDEVFREVEYFKNYEEPIDSPETKGRCIGECDVLLVNFEEEVALYHEVKPHRGEFSYADDQISRMDEFFPDWDIYGQKHTYR